MQAMLQVTQQPGQVLKELARNEPRYAKSAPFYAFFAQLLRALKAYPVC